MQLLNYFKLYPPCTVHYPFNTTTSSWSDFLSMHAVTQSLPASDSWPAYWKLSVTYKQPLYPAAQTPNPSLLLAKCEF